MASLNNSSPVIRQPSTRCEVELYGLLKQANLLQYYEPFIAQGGDDIHQLHDASEEEFLEIATLVGMGKKPLHIRRMQKHLSQWYKNKNPYSRGYCEVSSESSVTHSTNTTAVYQQAKLLEQSLSTGLSKSLYCDSITKNQAHGLANQILGSNQPGVLIRSNYLNGAIISECEAGDNLNINTNQSGGTDSCLNLISGNAPGRPRSQHNPDGVPVSMLPNAELSEEQLRAMMAATEQLINSLPLYPVKALNPRKQLHREIEAVMHMTPDDPRRPEQIRKFSAIYGRFDALRKTGRPMSLHEVSVNEAAAQLCNRMPSLLTRRDDLFPLARQVVKMAGIQNPVVSAASNAFSNPGLTPYQSMQLSPMMSIRNCNSPVGYSPSMFVGGHPALQIESSYNQPFAKRLRSHQLAEDRSSLTSSQYRERDCEILATADQITIETHLQSIKMELADLIGKSDELRESIRSVKMTGDAALLTRLHKCSDLLSIRHNNLLQEQTGLLRKLNVLGANSLCNNEKQGAGNKDFCGHGLTTPLETGTLFEDGMRLAQQLGLDDLATEIKGLKPTALRNEYDESEKIMGNNIILQLKKLSSEINSGNLKNAHHHNL